MTIPFWLESLGNEMNAVLDGPFRPERISFYLARDFNNVLDVISDDNDGNLDFRVIETQ